MVMKLAPQPVHSSNAQEAAAKQCKPSIEYSFAGEPPFRGIVRMHSGKYWHSLDL
jgi:hypothetical protein